jgi:pimeloyl-ACP methyl ester carboxylesterase
VTFTANDGSTRRGWFTQGEIHPDVAVIVVPGHAGNTAFALNDAAVFASAGYSTLIFEHRSCADPHLSASTGFYEAEDVADAAHFLMSLPELNQIVVFGLSEGGTAAILAAAREPAISAVIAAGGYTSLADDVLDPPQDSQSIPERVFRRMALWSLNVQLGLPPDTVSPVQVIHAISPRPIFLIYGDSEQIVGTALYDAAGNPKTLWIVPEAVHAGYASAAPEEYPRRLTDFMEGAVQLDTP